ncbi:MAG: 1-acyl-sn-glycerol-3-phosphate acyltransferase [Mucilaginibacter polytrichastri]|nr:1-acyl-sn-glycerol-3-phosphate acyltransferase [Mucilaginibacter polytrichastri]
MITAKRTGWICNLAAPLVKGRIHRGFKALHIEPVEVLPGHSVLYLSNHFSWWDGFLAGYVSHFVLKKHFHIMMQADHIESRRALRYLGAFSLEKNSRNMLHSLKYASGLLDDTQNLVALFPQGALRSSYTEKMTTEKGIARIIDRVTHPCQVVYASVLTDYFESFRPSAYIRLHHCCTSVDFDYAQLQNDIAHFHRQDLEKQRLLT